jgi:hypothetical protein
MKGEYIAQKVVLDKISMQINLKTRRYKSKVSAVTANNKRW